MGILMDNAVGHDVEHLYHTLQEYLMKIWEWNAQRLNIEISAGCAMYPQDGKYVDELYRYADYALQHAKVQGYRGFYLNYQPQVNPITGDIKGVEVLMRWKDEDGSVVSPAEFIPLMEGHRMIYRA